MAEEDVDDLLEEAFKCIDEVFLHFKFNILFHIRRKRMAKP